MAWRPYDNLIEGELDNTDPGRVTGWMRFLGMSEKVTFQLDGDFHRDIRGATIRLTNPNPVSKGSNYMNGFGVQQVGQVGDITAGLPPHDYANYPYIEWYSEANGRVVLELEPSQVEVIGTPFPSEEQPPVSRQKQERNLLTFIAESVGGSEVHTYTRAQAIEDGVLVDVTETAKEAGIKYPTALTQAVWSKYVEVPDGVQCQDESGRLWDILWMLYVGIKRSKSSGPELTYQLYVRNHNGEMQDSDLVTLKSVVGLGDDAEPVITIMLPHED